jgi:hypothetical protein
MSLKGKVVIFHDHDQKINFGAHKNEISNCINSDKNSKFLSLIILFSTKVVP